MYVDESTCDAIFAREQRGVLDALRGDRMRHGKLIAIVAVRSEDQSCQATAGDLLGYLRGDTCTVGQ